MTMMSSSESMVFANIVLWPLLYNLEWEQHKGSSSGCCSCPSTVVIHYYCGALAWESESSCPPFFFSIKSCLLFFSCPVLSCPDTRLSLYRWTSLLGHIVSHYAVLGGSFVVPKRGADKQKWIFNFSVYTRNTYRKSNSILCRSLSSLPLPRLAGQTKQGRKGEDATRRVLKKNEGKRKDVSPVPPTNIDVISIY